jgi:hypothetical protein
VVIPDIVSLTALADFNRFKMSLTQVQQELITTKNISIKIDIDPNIGINKLTGHAAGGVEGKAKRREKSVGIKIRSAALLLGKSANLAGDLISTVLGKVQFEGQQPEGLLALLAGSLAFNREDALIK